MPKVRKMFLVGIWLVLSFLPAVNLRINCAAHLTESLIAVIEAGTLVSGSHEASFRAAN
jgi:hypothetical protein